MLTGALNTYFDRLIELIAEHGGDVVKMAGDARIARLAVSLRNGYARGPNRTGCSLRLQLQDSFQDYRVAEGIKLTSKVALAAGGCSSCTWAAPADAGNWRSRVRRLPTWGTPSAGRVPARS